MGDLRIAAIFSQTLWGPLLRLACFERALRNSICSQLKQSMISQIFICLLHHLHGNINGKMQGGGGGHQSDRCVISE